VSARDERRAGAVEPAGRVQRLERFFRTGRGARIVAVLIWCALAAAAAAHLPRLSFDNDTWLPAAHPLRAELESFRAAFEPDEALLVAVELPADFFAREMTRTIRQLDAAIAALPAVRHVLSPATATTIIDRGDALEIISFGDALDKGFLDADSFRQRFDRSPYAGKLLSADHRVAALRVAVERGGAEARAMAVAAVVDTVRRHVETHDGAAAHFAGEAALKDELNRATRAQLPKLLALAALALAVFLRLACGNWRRAALVFTAAGAAVAACLGLLAARGWPMNAVLLALPVMVAVIAVADALHILARWDGLGGGEADDGHGDSDDASRLTATVRQTWLPCLAASVTSAVGFGAFALSELIPLRHFGLASAAAILYAYPLIVGAVWGGLWLAPGLRRSPRPRIAWKKLAAAAYHPSAAHAGRVALAALLIAALLGGGLITLRTETNFLTVFFAEDSRVRRAFDVVDAGLGGSGRVEVTLHGGAAAFASAAALVQVESLATRATAIDSVNQVDSYLLPVAMAHAAFAGGGDNGETVLPATDAALAQELLFLSLSRGEAQRDVLSPYLDFDHSSARLSLQTANLDSAALQQTLAATADVAADFEPAAVGATAAESVTITGLNVFIHHLGQLVLRTQAFSIALTLAIIAALLLVQFGWRAGACGLVANLLPLAATAGLVAWLGHPFDFAAILIAGVTLGLSVDDTIHFLHHYRRGGAGRGIDADGDDSRARALNRTARPIVLTSALFCCGLAVVGASDLVVLRKFAAFTAFGITAALLATLVVLPALLKLVGRRRG